MYHLPMTDEIILHTKWTIGAPLKDIFELITDFEKWPEYFPKVADSIKVTKLEKNRLQIDAVVKSFGRRFLVKMKTKILPGKGFASDNESPMFGTSGHEELLLSQDPRGTVIDYTYQIQIHKMWLRIVAKPLIGWFSMKYWEKAVIDQIRNRLEVR